MIYYHSSTSPSSSANNLAVSTCEKWFYDTGWRGSPITSRSLILCSRASLFIAFIYSIQHKWNVQIQYFLITFLCTMTRFKVEYSIKIAKAPKILVVFSREGFPLHGKRFVSIILFNLHLLQIITQDKVQNLNSATWTGCSTTNKGQLGLSLYTYKIPWPRPPLSDLVNEHILLYIIFYQFDLLPKLPAKQGWAQLSVCLSLTSPCLTLTSA